MEFQKLSNAKDYIEDQKYPEGNPPEGDDITKHIEYLKENGFRIEEGYFDSNDWELYRYDKCIQGHTYGKDQIRHVWEIINGYDRNADPTQCPNCKERIRKDAITYCIMCSDTKKICLLCSGRPEPNEMICKKCAKEQDG